MSKALLNQYYKEVHIAKQRGNTNEETLKTPFFNLINGMAEEQNLAVVREIFIRSSIGTNIRPDGILRNSLQYDHGYWESKDQKDDFEKEIQAKFDKGYPKNNILFDDSQKTVLFQEGKRYEASIYKEEEILPLLKRFINYERPEVKDFNTAVAKFGENLPDILQVLRTLLDQASVENQEFQRQRNNFLTICQQSINPNLSPIEVREMLIQHILTEEIFVSVFGNADYHRDNNVAQTLYELERTFFKGESKQNLLASIRPYYNKIKARATEMVTHSDKQGFLKVVYENFYKAYNPKGADRLGIVYTPIEIVKFMIEGTDFLLDKHFERTLGEPNVEILDPCTGTGTYICELIEHILETKSMRMKWLYCLIMWQI
ncbi:MAG: hypothetical protein EAZ97_04395 [Bacteroidetes bacterium]|nr:MAG: hypothetical protein EAZ97_04395 [Bacteroidota bacterium]